MVNKAGFEPCPFCGGLPIGLYAETDERGKVWGYMVHCECGGCGPTRGNPDSALRAWNARKEANPNAN